MLKKKFICIFPEGDNIHLVKDVGMIPYMMQREGYYDAYISFYKTKPELPYLETEVRGLKYIQLKKLTRSHNKNIFLFLLLNFWRYRVVQMFHPSPKKILISAFFRMFSFGRLTFYYKLDANEKSMEHIYNKHSIKFKIFKLLYNNGTVFTVENKAINDFFNEKSYFKTNYLPNGFLSNLPTRNIHKENLLLTVGRLGAPEKDTGTLLQAIAQVDLANWKAELVGPVEKEFEPQIVNFFKENPGLKDKVIFSGAISDRALLEEKYARAKVFVLTSLWESFGIVLVEALSRGCFLISSDLLPAREITDNEKYGRLFPVKDPDALSRLLQSIINDELELPNPEEIKNFAENHYSWEKLAENLSEILKSAR